DALSTADLFTQNTSKDVGGAASRVWNDNLDSSRSLRPRAGQPEKDRKSVPASIASSRARSSGSVGKGAKTRPPQARSRARRCPRVFMCIDAWAKSRASDARRRYVSDFAHPTHCYWPAFGGKADISHRLADTRDFMSTRPSLVWRFISPHHFCSESEMRTSEPKPH